MVRLVRLQPGQHPVRAGLQGIGRVSFNTTLAACSAGLAALFFAYARRANGISASPSTASWPARGDHLPLLLGQPHRRLLHRHRRRGRRGVWATDVLEYLRIDDPIGAVPVHMVAGIWGTLSLGLFATGAYGLPTPTARTRAVIVKGLFYGGGTAQLVAQAIGSGRGRAPRWRRALSLMYAVKATGTLRVSAEGELEGLDSTSTACWRTRSSSCTAIWARAPRHRWLR